MHLPLFVPVTWQWTVQSLKLKIVSVYKVKSFLMSYVQCFFRWITYYYFVCVFFLLSINLRVVYLTLYVIHISYLCNVLLPLHILHSQFTIKWILLQTQRSIKFELSFMENDSQAAFFCGLCSIIIIIMDNHKVHSVR